MTGEHIAGEPVAADRSGVGFLLGLAARVLWKKLAERLVDLGLDASAYIVMVNVAITEERDGRGPLVAEMVDQLALKPEEVDAATGRLTRLGLLKSVSQDGSIRLALQEKGRAMMPALQNEAHWLLENLLSGFTYEEIDALGDYPRRLIGNLGGQAV